MEVALPSTEITIQEIVDQVRDFEDDPSPQGGLDIPHILNASGKQPLGGTDMVGMTITLIDWTIKFADRLAPPWVLCNIRGGNIVAYNSTTQEYVTPVTPAAYVNTNITASSSATLSEQDAIQYASYQNAVWVDTTSSNVGIEYPMGTREYPVNNLANAITIANLKGFAVLQILTSMTLGSGTISNFEIIGKDRVSTSIYLDPALVCNGVKVRQCNVSGTLDGDTVIKDCVVSNLDYVNGQILDSGLNGLIELAGSEEAVIANCYTIDQDSPPIIDMGGSGQDLAMPNYSGIVTIKNLTSATEEVGIGLNSGKVILDVSVTAGNFTISGVGLIEDNSTSVTDLNTDGLINKELVANSVWDEATADHQIAGSTGKAITDAGGSGNPWSLPVAGNTLPGTFGEKVGKKLLTFAKWLGLS